MDQAKGLRDLAKTHRQARSNSSMAANRFPRVIAVTSGKGGVGKTNIVGNLAVSMARTGKRVVVIDADVGLANVDILFNLRPEYSIRHVVSSEKRLDQVMVRSDHGVHIIPGGSGFADLTSLNEGEKLNLLTEFDTLADKADIILVDTGAGISANVLYFNAAADECIVVATAEPTSITDAYALMKVMSKEYGTRYFKLIVNMADSEKEAKKVFSSLSNALDRFLKNVVLEYLGYIPFDRQIQKAVQKRSLLLDHAPDSVAAHALDKIRESLDNSRRQNGGSLTFFMNKVLQTGINH